ncbi:MAG TPA: indole-3-glycerol phosphate synthase TrpC [Acidimicrobiales bacterium]|nr:indole-3-glycerol phosphate synthase TrpC [Acidimicrobiales bacterium]
MGTYLDRIVAAHRAVTRRDARDLATLVAACDGLAPTRSFAGALTARPGTSVIAEVKRRSPSRGDLFPDLVAADLARRYEAGGASCLSVLTDAEFFGGSVDDLVEARAAVALPVLRKDFTVDDRDVVDARLMGADAVLAIVAALDARELRRVIALGGDLGLEVLVEVHDAAELDEALGAGATIVGVNQRDLTTFDVDRELALRLAPSIPSGVTSVAESGVRHAADVAALAAAGYDAVLVGETLVTSGDPGDAVAGLVAAGVAVTPCS